MTRKTLWFLVLVSLALIVLAGCTNAERRCESARMEVDYYESCAATVDCQLSENERRYLLWAKRDEIRWCEHPFL